jgi:hypothetical protein
MEMATLARPKNNKGASHCIAFNFVFPKPNDCPAKATQLFVYPFVPSAVCLNLLNPEALVFLEL